MIFVFNKEERITPRPLPRFKLTFSIEVSSAFVRHIFHPRRRELVELGRWAAGGVELGRDRGRARHCQRLAADTQVNGAPGIGLVAVFVAKVEGGETKKLLAGNTKTEGSGHDDGRRR